MARRYTPEDIADIITNSDEEYIHINYRLGSIPVYTIGLDREGIVPVRESLGTCSAEVSPKIYGYGSRRIFVREEFEDRGSQPFMELCRKLADKANSFLERAERSEQYVVVEVADADSRCLYLQKQLNEYSIRGYVIRLAVGNKIIMARTPEQQA